MAKKEIDLSNLDKEQIQELYDGESYEGLVLIQNEYDDHDIEDATVTFEHVFKKISPKGKELFYQGFRIESAQGTEYDSTLTKVKLYDTISQQIYV